MKEPPMKSGVRFVKVNLVIAPLPHFLFSLRYCRLFPIDEPIFSFMTSILGVTFFKT